MRRRRIGVGQAAVAALALAPGFLFPLVLAARRAAESSDLFLLALATANTLATVLGGAIELHTAAQVGGVTAGESGVVAQRALAAYDKRLAWLVVPTVLIAGPLLALLYFSGNGGGIQFWRLSIILLLMPVLAGFSSARSGALIGLGNTMAPVMGQSARWVPPLLAILVWPSVSLDLIGTLFISGEFIRLVVLRFLVQRVSRGRAEIIVELNTRQIPWQATSTAVSQGSPITDRSILTGAASGSITAYELSDKFFFAAAQLVNYGLLLKRVSAWTRLGNVGVKSARRRFFGDVRRLGMASALMGVLGGIMLSLASLSGWVPHGWERGLDWGAVLVTSLPAYVVSQSCVRMMIIGGRGPRTLLLAITIVVLNAALDWALFLVIGPVGVPLATGVVRILSSLAYLWYVISRFDLLHRHARAILKNQEEPEWSSS